MKLEYKCILTYLNVSSDGTSLITFDKAGFDPNTPIRIIL